MPNDLDADMPPLADVSESDEENDENDKTLVMNPLDLLALAASVDKRSAQPEGKRVPLGLLAITADDSPDCCEVCQVSLGASDFEKAQARAFRCGNCELKEWEAETGKWGTKQPLAEFMSTLAKACGSCSSLLAAGNTMPPEVRVWEGGWRPTTLAKLGLIYHLGHDAHPCLWPLEPPSPMVVLTLRGCHSVNMKFCGCGRFEGGERGRTQQLLSVGCHRGSLEHPQLCTTFEVPSLVSEARQPEAPSDTPVETPSTC
ncbi:hypothetical protein C8R46DRAFT_1046257 [Mycena filopes]|nr:hypothetical protein C8R46DRAFT_1046257 [Mycena filopes]